MKIKLLHFAGVHSPDVGLLERQYCCNEG